MGCLISLLRRKATTVESISLAYPSECLESASLKVDIKRITSDYNRCVYLPSSGINLRYAFISETGAYPKSSGHDNEDSVSCLEQISGIADIAFFAVFDGHGPFGRDCSHFAREKVAENLRVALYDGHLQPPAALHDALTSANEQLHQSEVDDTCSGTTAVTVLLDGIHLYCANVGDSRAIGVVYDEASGLRAVELSSDHTPFRKDELARVLKCGASVMSHKERLGCKEPDLAWSDSDPPRLYVPCERYPGTAFTRSLGDWNAESIGVISDPEIICMTLTHQFRYIILASDGVFEFLSNERVVELVGSCPNAMTGCQAVVSEARKEWMEEEGHVDDISIVVIEVDASKRVCCPVQSGAAELLLKEETSRLVETDLLL